jgi:hypothetical protein
VLYCVVGFALLTVAAVVVLAFAPVPMTIGARIAPLKPLTGGAIFVAGRPMGSEELRLIDDDFFRLCGHPSPTAEWPPPGAWNHGFFTGWKVLAEQCIVPPTDPYDDYVWHFKLTNAGHEMRLALPIRAVDIAGNPLMLHYETGSHLRPWAGSITLRFSFGPFP